MKQKVKSTPKQLVRRGLDDGTERLRGHLRDAAQRGQADDYGGDQIEDAAVGGARRAGRGTERGIEALLKKKKNGRNRISQEEPRSTTEPPAPQESPADPPSREPRIKTREAVTAREGGTAPSEGGRQEATPAAGSERQRIKIRESTVRSDHKNMPPASRDETGLPRIRTREDAAHEVPASVEPPEQTGSVRPQIKTREAVAARESSASPSGGDRTEPPPATEPERQKIKIRESTVRGGHENTPPALRDGTELPRIRTRESAVHDPPVSEGPVVRTGSERPQIKMKEAVTGAPSDHAATITPPSRKEPPERLSIKTKDAYIQRQPASEPEQPSQALVQGKREFMRERGRTAAIKQAEIRRAGNGSVPQVKGGGDPAPPAPAQHGYAPSHPVHRPMSPAISDIQPVRESGKAIVKTGRSVRKAPERTAHHSVKMAERSSRKTIKTAQRTAKTATRTAKTAGQTAQAAQKTAQATVKATQRAVQAARATAKAVATTAKAAVKATAAAIKAAIAATQELIAAIAAGGWAALVVVLVILMVGLLIASPFGIFFSDGGSPDAASPTAAIVQINSEYADTLSALQAGGTYDRVEIHGRPPSWADVFAVFAAKTAGAADGESVAVLDADTVEKLRVVFWDMTKITTTEDDIDHPAEGGTPAWTEKVLTITVTPRTPDDMRVFYAFTEQQNAALDELLTAANREMWSNLLYGSNGEIVTVALSQVGNMGGQPYWSWYGFNSHVNWCACFVSWCANECGYIDAGVIPKFASCTSGSNWFKDRGQWQGSSYEPRPGDLIFFDWDNKGSSGPQDDVPDHVGIVERVENGIVYTVEGNTSDSCRQRSYSVGYYEIWGYATPIY